MAHALPCHNLTCAEADDDGPCCEACGRPEWDCWDFADGLCGECAEDCAPSAAELYRSERTWSL